jgi:ABC-type transporter Mla MlaB component
MILIVRRDWLGPCCIQMMSMDVRITTEPAGSTTLVTVSGRLAEEACVELERVVREITGDVRLDIGDLRATDAAGLALLRRLRDSGMWVERLSPYMRLILDAVET